MKIALKTTAFQVTYLTLIHELNIICQLCNEACSEYTWTVHCLVRRSTWEMYVMAGLPNLWELMPDDLKWSWCKNNRNKVYKKYNAVKSSWNHPSHWTMEKFSSMKSALAPKRLGTTVYGINIIFFFYFPRELNIFSKVATTLWAPEVNIGCNYEIHEQAKSTAPTKLGMHGQQPQPRRPTSRCQVLPYHPKSAQGLL